MGDISAGFPPKFGRKRLESASHMPTTKTQTQLITLKEIRNDPKIRAYIEGANNLLEAMGYTEHGHRHAGIVSSITRYILEGVGTDPRHIEIASIAGYMHDIGNVVNRVMHPVIGASLAFHILDELNMEATEIALIVGAIGNHEEADGTPFNHITAALVIADKSDVHFSRVQNPVPSTFDIHDRVNFAVQRSRVNLDADNRTIELELHVDTNVATLMEYFEIFLQRMVMCRHSADRLGYKFRLNCNGTFLE